eukprot:NODE_1248_length_1611_cov_0.429233.p1 type:complete len:288 gc:universal NODE_1248_length_1611_cov_0.429233:1398-535(-)
MFYSSQMLQYCSSPFPNTCFMTSTSEYFTFEHDIAILNSIPEILKLHNSDELFFILQRVGIFAVNMTCPHNFTHGSMTLIKHKSKPDGHLWRCKCCKKDVSPRCGSLFSHSKLPIWKCCMLLNLFFARENIKKSAYYVKIHRFSVSLFFAKLREYMQQAIRVLFKPLEGEIEVDEAIWRKRKFNRGRLKCTFWILGFIERHPQPGCKKQIIMMPVLNRKSSTMQYFIRKCIAPNSTIFSDSYKSYDWIDYDDKYVHFKVNHAENYVDPENPNIHTQNITLELWRQEK